MGLAIALNNALSGLNVNQQALSTLSQNIANANTAGYSRQIVTQQALYLDGQGAGVSILDITRKVDQYLLQSVQSQNSVVGRISSINDYHSRIQLLLGQPGGGNSMTGYIGNFFDVLQALGNSPDNNTLKSSVVNSGNTLAEQMRQLAENLQSMRLQADQDIQTAVSNVNKALSDLQSVNLNIGRSTSLGQSIAGLLDKRDALLNDIAQYLDIQTITQPDNSVFIFTGNGVSLLDQSAYQLSYTSIGSIGALVSDASFDAIIVRRVNEDGSLSETSDTLVTSGPSSEVASTITTGRIKGLLDMRDRQIPNLLNELDLLAATMRDEINRVHNSGSSFPPANSYTGTRAVNASDTSEWGGSIRIAVLDQNGQPVPSPYSDQDYMPPLMLDLSTLDTGDGAGQPSVQGIIDAINDYFGVQQNKVELGNLNNIELVSTSTSIPGDSNEFTFDFDLQNLSATGSNFYITDIEIRDSGGVALATPTSTIPSFDIANYVTSLNSGEVVITTTAEHGLSEGDIVYLSDPGGAVDGIPAADLTGFFTITGVTSTGFQVTAANGSLGATGDTVAGAGSEVLPPYGSVDAGESGRTGANGVFTADLSGNPTSPFYTITIDAAVEDENGNISTAQISYRVGNNQTSLLNDHFAPTAANGDATLVMPDSPQPFVTASLVDEDGNALPKFAGEYVTSENGYLKIRANNSNYTIVIDSLDSEQLGLPDSNPAVEGSGRSFAHYFELNNFFASNLSTTTGDTTANSALNMRVSDALLDNPNLISMGGLQLTPASVNPDAPPPYSYERAASDSSVIQALATLGSTNFQFIATGDLGTITQSFTSYAGAIIGSASTKASTAKTDQTNAQALLDGYAQQSASISGVNLDTELANTIIYQNAYTASARVITVTNELFDVLLQTFS